jgi:hypothetical protein
VFADFDGDDLSLRGFPEWLLKEAQDLTPATALADLKARIKREVLEEAAKLADDWVIGPGNLAAELRRMAGGDHA